MPDAADIVLVLTTLPADGEPDQLARALVDRHLAACVSVLAPMQSTYRWKGKVEEAAERQVVIKTAANRIPDLKRAIAELHPYEVPELLILSVSGGADAYLAWIRDGIRSKQHEDHEGHEGN